MTENHKLVGLADAVSESMLLVIATLTAWAYGGVDAFSELIVYIILFNILLMRGVADWFAGERDLRMGAGKCAVLGVLALALLQAYPIGSSSVWSLSPGTAALRGSLTPGAAETVRGDGQPPVPLPSPTLSLEPEETRHAAVRIAALLLLFSAATRERAGWGAFRRFTRVIACNAAALSLFAILQSLAWDGRIYWVRQADLHQPPGGPFFSHNHLAAYLNLGLGLALGLLMSGRPRRERDGSGSRPLFFAYVMSLILGGVLISQSRSGVIAMCVSLAFGYAIMRIPKGRALTTLVAVTALAAAFLLAIGSLAPILRLGTIAETVGSGFNGRADIWSAAYQTWRLFPLLGTGFGTYAVATAPHFHPTEKLFFRKFASHGESEYIEMVVEGGLVGLALLTVLIVDVFARSWSSHRRAEEGLRPLIGGGIVALVALATQCTADFPLHLAGIAAPAVILAAHLGRFGGAGPRLLSRLSSPGPGRLLVASKNLLAIAAAAVLIHAQLSFSELERVTSEAGVPLPGTTWIGASVPAEARQNLERARVGLTAALKARPDWAEGHARLGLVLLGLYRHAAAEALGPPTPTAEPAEAVPTAPSPNATATGGRAVSPPADASDKAAGPAEGLAHAQAKTDPLWLHHLLHSVPKDRLEEFGNVIEYEPVQEYLVPAARSFLNARRSSPLLAVPHVWLAGLDFLLEGGDTPAAYLKRAVSLSGNRPEIFLLAAQIAQQTGDLDLNIDCLRRYLALRPEDAMRVVEYVSVSKLTPDQILQIVRPNGATQVFQFGLTLYASPLQYLRRVRFMRVAEEDLPTDRALSPNERTWLEGRIKAEIGRRDEAARLMERAIYVEPMRSDWRYDYIQLQLNWGEYEKALKSLISCKALFPKEQRFFKLFNELRAAQ